MDFTDHVVVGVDGSSTSIAAAVWARDIARAGHWPLGIVHTQGLAPDVREMLGEGGTLMCVESMLAPALVQASRTAAMVVVASRGQGSPALPIVDAAAEAVLQEAAGPVVVLPSTTWNTLERPLVLGLDAERPSPASIRFAVSVAGRTGARLKVIVDDKGQGPDRARLQTVQVLTRVLGSDLPETFDVEVSAHELTDALVAKASEASLTVVGSQDARRCVERERSENRLLLRLSTSPFAVVANTVEVDQADRSATP